LVESATVGIAFCYHDPTWLRHSTAGATRPLKKERAKGSGWAAIRQQNWVVGKK
jgi:hypothetical protein